tara:strand:+ start:25926 stop:26510 length:585 start_codon:yes stop_codon:yes gene_type:complete
MATTDLQIKDDKYYFDYLWKFAHPDASRQKKKWVYEEMLLTGEIQIETMLENAIEKVGGPKKNSKHGMDFEDGSDAKKCCVRTRNHEKEYGASVKGIESKVGDLRVLVFERKQEKFYHLLIPYDAYRGMKYLEIPFNLHGEPRRVTQRGKSWPWLYEVSSFEEMATGSLTLYEDNTPCLKKLLTNDDCPATIAA